MGEAYKQLSGQAFRPEFLGYQQLETASRVVLLVHDGKELSSAEAGEQVEVVTQSTPFYGESGGQVGDQGVILGKDLTLEVHDTVKDPTGLIIHKGKIIKGRIGKDQEVTLRVDMAKRQATALNHTATHILHGALRTVLGEHVKQAGSLVAPERLRFDFTHFSHVDMADLERIEALVNDRIRDNVPVETVEMDAEQAMQTGAMALFEEKYGDQVRVVSLADFSKELCGGTHTDRTGNIGLFKIVMEASVAAGIRRIEALTGAAALEYVQKMARSTQNSMHLLRVKQEEVVPRIEQLLSAYKSSEKEVEKLKAALADARAQAGDEDLRNINGVAVLAKRVAVDKPAALRELADRFRDRIKSGIVVLGSPAKDKALLIVIVTKDLSGRFHAGEIVKQLSAVVGGGGGGREDMAQAGGPMKEKLDLALEKAYEVIAAVK
jgi:alanyl-tRNA synthetase